MISRKGKENTRMIAGVGIFAALAATVSFATSFLKIDYLSLDAGDIIIVLASFIYGPVSGALISLISSLIGFLYSGTGFWGMLMDFFSSCIFSVSAAMIYRRKRSFKLAIIGIYASVLITTAAMMPLNILITPLYTGATAGVILKLIPAFLLPFNFGKTLFNGSAVLLLYKPVVKAMRSAHLAPPSKAEPRQPSKINPTRTALVIGAVSLILALLVLLIMGYVYGFKVESPFQ